MSDFEPAHSPGTRAAAVLVEKLKEFRQSYNRTHGQVCEFFEQAQVIEKIYHHSPGPSKTIAKRETNVEECETEDCCDEQKTWSIKQKLNSWRAVMREVVAYVCPNLQLENQPDINPGLMKHVLDEIRKLKTELAFQHNTILELTHQIESYQSKNQQKDRLIEKLLHQCRERQLHDGESGQVVHSCPRDLQDDIQALHPVTSFDRDELLHFGSIDCLSDLSIDLQDMHSCLEDESGEMHIARGEQSIHRALASPPLLRSHAIANEGMAVLVPRDNGSNEKAVDNTISEGPSSSDIPCALDRIPSGERWTARRTVVGACGKLGLVIVTCKIMHRLTGK